MKPILRRTLLGSLSLLSLLVLAMGPTLAAAQGRPAPKSNQAFLYEMSEDATLYGVALACALGDVSACTPPVPLAPGTSPTGLVVAGTSTPGFPTNRSAVSALQGVTPLGTALCPVSALVTVPKLKECTVTATGMDSAALSVDLGTGQVNPTGGALWGTFATVIQLDNPVDSPEWPLVTGAFYGTITFGAPGVPIGSATGTFALGAQLSNTGDPAAFQTALNSFCSAAPSMCLPFTAKFRQPFALDAKGHHKKPERREDAFYLLDSLKRVAVQQDERAVGWPTVRFEITFP